MMLLVLRIRGRPHNKRENSGVCALWGVPEQTRERRRKRKKTEFEPRKEMQVVDLRLALSTLGLGSDGLRQTLESRLAAFQGKVRVGRGVVKDFGPANGGKFQGRIVAEIRVDHVDGPVYTVEYTDGDREDMEEWEVRAILEGTASDPGNALDGDVDVDGDVDGDGDGDVNTDSVSVSASASASASVSVAAIVAASAGAGAGPTVDVEIPAPTAPTVPTVPTVSTVPTDPPHSYSYVCKACNGAHERHTREAGCRLHDSPSNNSAKSKRSHKNYNSNTSNNSNHGEADSCSDDESEDRLDTSDLFYYDKKTQVTVGDTVTLHYGGGTLASTATIIGRSSYRDHHHRPLVKVR
jgi:hypothetical protein